MRAKRNAQGMLLQTTVQQELKAQIVLPLHHRRRQM